MVPVKNKKYLIDYRPSSSDDSLGEYGYVGMATYTGEEEQIDKETLYLFQGLQEEFGFTNTALFSEEDIMEEIVDFPGKS
jgi:hypothetical protein